MNRQTYDEAGRNYIAREIGLVKVKGKDQLVPVVEVVAHCDDGVDPRRFQRFTEALARLQKGESPEEELLSLQRQWPDDHVIAMCIDRLKSNSQHNPTGSPPREMVFEFESK